MLVTRNYQPANLVRLLPAVRTLAKPPEISKADNWRGRNHGLTSAWPPILSQLAAAPAQRRHVGLGPGLVEENQALRLQPALQTTPELPGRGDVRPRLLGGAERLFFSVSPSWRTVRHIVPVLTDTPYVPHSHARRSASVAEGRRSTSRAIAASNPARRGGLR